MTQASETSRVEGPRFAFRRRHRLSGSRAFQAVYAGKVRKASGPLVVFLTPNEIGQPRLGLSVGRRVGRAHARVAIKRRLREAFRTAQHDLPGWTDAGRPCSYDVIIQVRPHEPLGTGEYAALLGRLAAQGHEVWERRRARHSPGKDRS
ncbi:MAG: ribonuclease P protein component [Planctomycetota bacterium]